MNRAQKKSNEPFEITGNWSIQSRHLKQLFTQLTAADLKYKSGEEEELLSRLEHKLHKEREEVISFIKSVWSR